MMDYSLLIKILPVTVWMPILLGVLFYIYRKNKKNKSKVEK
jgi:cbb3-type cytochrome oxidase subunit 3